jgi:hypothetical protein
MKISTGYYLEVPGDESVVIAPRCLLGGNMCHRSIFEAVEEAVGIMQAVMGGTREDSEDSICPFGPCAFFPEFVFQFGN